jgi:hypothetical protein
MLRFAHFHAILNDLYTLADHAIALADLSRINSLSSFIINGLWTWRADVRILRAKLAHLACQLV